MSHWNESLSQIIGRVGLANHERLTQVGRNRAVAIVAALLSRDMAYMQRLKAADSARTYAGEVLADFSESTFTFYTNALWDEYFESSSFGFSGLIDSATFANWGSFVRD